MNELLERNTAQAIPTRNRLRTLLLVTYYFPPTGASGTYRMLGFAEHLPKFGWDVVVVAPTAAPYEPIDKRLCERVPDETKDFRTTYPDGLLGRLGLRLFKHRVWLPRARASCQQAIAECSPDLVLTSSPPHCVHSVGRYVKAKWGIPWIADFRDPWISGNDFLKSTRTTWLTRPFEQREEQATFRDADLILTNSPNAARRQAEVYPQGCEKTAFLTNGYDPDLFDADPPRRKSQGVRLIHTGELYAGRDPRPLLAAIERLNRANPKLPVHVDFVGHSSWGEYDIQKEAAARGLQDRVSVHKHRPYGEALRMMQESDILVLLDNPTRTVGIPAKLFEYFGAQRPILAFADSKSDTAWALSQAGAPYRVVGFDDIGRVATAIEELAGQSRDSSSATASTTPDVFTREQMARRLAEMMSTVIRA